MIFKLALRNLLRKRQRTAITAGALGLAGLLMVFFSTLIAGFQATMIGNLIGLETGHLQAHLKGYRSDPDLYGVIPRVSQVLKALSKDGAKASPRLYGWGLAALGDNSSGVEVRGLDPALEKEVTQVHEKLSRGAWLEQGEAESVVLGKELARKLKAEPGQKLLLLAQAADGSLSDRLYTVKGVLHNVSAKADEAGLFMTEAAFRDLFQLPEGFHEIAVKLPGKSPEPGLAAAALSKELADLEILDWRGLKPLSAQILDTQKIGVYILMTLAYGAVGLVIFNAMLMNVFERLREFGVMRALGATPAFLLKLIYTEALLEAGLAALLALALGVPLSLRFETKGLDLGGLSSGARVAGMVLEPIMYSRVTLGSVFPPIAFLFCLAALAVIYPAFKAALLRPVKAIYHR